MFYVITRASHTTEKILMVYVAAARETYNYHEISNDGLISRKYNPTDVLTKPRFYKQLYELLKRDLIIF